MSAADPHETAEDRAHEALVDFYYRPRHASCQCRFDMPGTCPGPAYCPMCEAPPEDRSGRVSGGAA